MKNIFYILLLLPTIIFAQYPSNSGQKITLGEQTTADGLVYRGLVADTTRKPSVDTMAYIILDTTTNLIWHYKKGTSNAWLQAGGGVSVSSFSAGTTGLTPSTATTGAVTLGGTLAVANGGTGSTTQNFVDLTTTQSSIGGAKTFSSSVTALQVISRKDATTSGTDAQFISENRTGSSGQYAIYGTRLDNGSGAGFVPVAFGAVQTAGAGRTGDFIVAVSNTDNVNLSTHERMRITSGGNVGIGTESPTARLHVKGSTPDGTASAFKIDNSGNTNLLNILNNGVATFRNISNSGAPATSGTTVNATLSIDNAFSVMTNIGNLSASPYSVWLQVQDKGNLAITYPLSLQPNGGNVGIGTTSPSAKLHVANTGRALAVLRILQSDQTAFFTETFAINNDGGGASPFIYASQPGASFPFNNYGELIIQGNPRSGYNNGISFITGTSNSQAVVARISGGNVGIGTTSPLGRLEVADVSRLTTSGAWSSATLAMKQNGGFIGDYSQIVFGYHANTQTYGSAYLGFLETNQGANGFGDLVFGTRAVNTDIQPTERMRITSDGKVGIGTNNPGVDFEIFKSTGQPQFVCYNGTNWVGLRGDVPLISRNSGQDLLFVTYSTYPTTGAVVQMTLQSNGKLKIGDLAGINDVGADANGVLQAASSDINLKNTIESSPFGLNEILLLNPVTFLYNDENRKIDSDVKEVGFIAQDVFDIIPNAVSSIANGDLQLDYRAITATLVKAIQEQNMLIKALEQRIINLENK